jgi:hypothetical protein
MPKTLYKPSGQASSFIENPAAFLEIRIDVLIVTCAKISESVLEKTHRLFIRKYMAPITIHKCINNNVIFEKATKAVFSTTTAVRTI